MRALLATTALALVTIADAALAAGPAAAKAMLPHRATYELSRAAASRDAQIVAVAGRMEVTFAASCDGWQIEQSLWMRLFGEAGVAADSLAVLKAFETADGRSYWFNTHAYEGGRLDEVIRGSARADPATGEVELSLGTPKREPAALPTGTLFPIAHMQALLDAAEAGERALVRTVFDGSTLESPYEVSAFFGKAVAPHARASEASRAWPVRLAYFRPGAIAAAPEFEMSMLLHEGGLAGDMVYDYGDLEIDVELSEVEMLDPPGGCED